MHIVKLLTKINETGLTTNTLDLTESFVKKGHTVTVFIGKSEYYNDGLKYLEERFADSGANIIWYGNVNKSGILQKILQTVFILYKIVCLKPDIIHAQSPYLSFIPWLLRKKFVSTVHVADLPKRFEYKNATRVIAISDETKKYAINHFQYKEDDIDLVFHGVSLRYENKITNSEIKSLKEKLNILDTDIVIGIVASIEKRKGHDILLNAIDKLGSLNSNIKVLIVGSYKSKNEQGWLEDIIQSTHIKNNIIIVPYQDPKPFYDLMDVFVLPSRLEGFPLVTIEAFLSECCIIRSNVEGAYNQITHGETGFIFENENTDELMLLLKKIILDKELRISIAKKGKEFALKNFTSDIMADNTLKVYKKVLKNIN